MWKWLKDKVTPERNTLRSLDNAFQGTQAVFNWCQDFEMELGNAGVDDDKYYRLRISYCQEFLETFSGIDWLMRLTMAQATVNVILVETAQVPVKPIQRRTLYTALAAVVGAMLALGVAFLLEYLDDTIKTPDDVSQALGLDTFGAIGRLARREEELVVAAQPLSPTAEAFRVLCTNVRFSNVNGPSAPSW